MWWAVTCSLAKYYHRIRSEATENQGRPESPSLILSQQPVNFSLRHADIRCISLGRIVARPAVDGFWISTLVMGHSRDKDFAGTEAAISIGGGKAHMVDPAIAIPIPLGADLSGPVPNPRPSGACLPVPTGSSWKMLSITIDSGSPSGSKMPKILTGTNFLFSGQISAGLA